MANNIISRLPYMASVEITEEELQQCCVKKGVVKKLDSRQTVTVTVDSVDYADVPVWVHTDCGARLASLNGEALASPEDYFKDAALMFPFPAGVALTAPGNVTVTTLEPQVLVLFSNATETFGPLGVIQVLQSVAQTFPDSPDLAFPTFKMYGVFKTSAVKFYHDDLPWRTYYPEVGFFTIVDITENKIARLPTVDINGNISAPVIDAKGLRAGTAGFYSYQWLITRPGGLYKTNDQETFTNLTVVNRYDGSQPYTNTVANLPELTGEPERCCYNCGVLNDGSCSSAGWAGWPGPFDLMYATFGSTGPYYGSTVDQIVTYTTDFWGTKTVTYYYRYDDLRYVGHVQIDKSFSAEEGEGYVIGGSLVPVYTGFFQKNYPNSNLNIPYRDTKIARRGYFFGSPYITLTFNFNNEELIIDQVASMDRISEISLGTTLQAEDTYTIASTFTFLGEETTDSVSFTFPTRRLYLQVRYPTGDVAELVIPPVENFFYNSFDYLRIYTAYIIVDYFTEGVGWDGIYNYMGMKSISCHRDVDDMLFSTNNYMPLVEDGFTAMLDKLPDEPFYDFYTGVLTEQPDPSASVKRSERRQKKMEFLGYYFVPFDIGTALLEET